MSSDSDGTLGTGPRAGLYDVFDVHLHAMPTELYGGVSQARFGRHWRTAGTNFTDAGVLREQMLAPMDGSGIRQGLLSGRNDLVQALAQRCPRPLPGCLQPDVVR